MPSFTPSSQQTRRERLSQYASPPAALIQTRRQTLSDPWYTEREKETQAPPSSQELPVHAAVEAAIVHCAQQGGVSAFAAFRAHVLGVLERCATSVCARACVCVCACLYV